MTTTWMKIMWPPPYPTPASSAAIIKVKEWLQTTIRLLFLFIQYQWYNIMKFPKIFYHSSSSMVSNDEDTSPSDLLSTPLHLSEPSYDHRARHQDDLVSIISAMQESENGLYNPTRKFTYHININVANPMQQVASPLVDEVCRTRMLTWCSHVSTCIVSVYISC